MRSIKFDYDTGLNGYNTVNSVILNNQHATLTHSKDQIKCLVKMGGWGISYGLSAFVGYRSADLHQGVVDFIWCEDSY